MSRALTCILVAALAGFVPSQRLQAETAKEIIQKAIEAHGGLDNLKKYPGIEMTSKGKMSIMGAEVDVENKDLILLPDRFKSTMKMTAFGQKVESTQIYDAGKIKVTANGMDVPLTDDMKKELKNAMELNAATELYPLLDEKKFELSIIDKPGKVDGKEVVGVLAKTNDKHEMKLFFDAKSFNLVEAEHQALNAAQKEVTQQQLFRDYKKVDGILRPTKLELIEDGKKTGTFEITEIKNLEKIDKKEFDVSD